MTQPYTTPSQERCSVSISRELLTRDEATARWAQLIESGYEGWSQWTSAVRRVGGGAPLPSDLGPLLAGECYREDTKTSYKLQHQGRAWSLVEMRRGEGDSHWCQTREFVTIEPGDDLAPHTVTHYKKAQYEVFWEAKPSALAGDALRGATCHQPGPVCARLTSL